MYNRLKFLYRIYSQRWEKNCFIHSNYIGRKGVTKEKVMNSTALQSSKTRWVVSLTGDKDFLKRWLKG